MSRPRSHAAPARVLRASRVFAIARAAIPPTTSVVACGLVYQRLFLSP